MKNRPKLIYFILSMALFIFAVKPFVIPPQKEKIVYKEKEEPKIILVKDLQENDLRWLSVYDIWRPKNKDILIINLNAPTYSRNTRGLSTKRIQVIKQKEGYSIFGRNINQFYDQIPCPFKKTENPLFKDDLVFSSSSSLIFGDKK